MTPPIAHPTINWLAISPEIALAVAGVVIVMLRSVLRRRPIVAGSFEVLVAAPAGACRCTTMGTGW